MAGEQESHAVCAVCEVMVQYCCGVTYSNLSTTLQKNE